jgi:hypothetical protein
MSFAEIFGKPGEGSHASRLWLGNIDLAFVDVAATIAMAFVISFFSGFSFLMILACLFIAGIALHRFFNVRTTIDKILFSSS